MLEATRATKGLRYIELFQVADSETACDTRHFAGVALFRRFDAARQARQAL